jgi:hypothetical protein
MPKNNWVIDLRDVLEREGRGIREELRDNLEFVVGKYADTIASFSKSNVKLTTINYVTDKFNEYPSHDEELSLFLAATYFANANYFQRPVDLDSEFIDLCMSVVHNKATYRETGTYKHKIYVPCKEFNTNTRLFSTLDSGTRHAIHHNIQQDMGLNAAYLAVRSYHVIGQVIAVGIAAKSIKDKTPQIDPYLNDNTMSGESGGHNGANYLLRLLSKDPTGKSRQLYWLSRLPLRKAAQRNDAFNQFLALMEEIVSYSHKDTFEQESERIPPSPIDSPFCSGHEPLHHFYRTGAFPANFYPTVLSDKIEKARKLLINHLPYEVDERSAVNLGGQKITRFASQLDFVALTLDTTQPRELYMKAAFGMAH